MREDLQRLYMQKEAPHVQPFYSIDYKNDDDILTWIKETDSALLGFYSPLFREQKNNLKIFMSTGVNPNFFSPLISVFLQQGVVESNTDDININELYLLVMEQVATIVSNELTSQVLPNNDDYNDKIASKFVKMWLDSMSYDLDIDVQRVKWEIQKKLFGEAFVIPVWDAEAGDIHPLAKELDEDIDMVDEDNKKIRNADGDYVKVDKYQRIGDVDLVNPLPFDVMIEPKNRFKDANWFYYVEYVDTEDLRRKYKKVDFGDGTKISRFDASTGFNKDSKNHTKVYHFTHRSHEFLQEGRKIICTDDAVLVNKSMKNDKSFIQSKKLPLIRFCDFDLGFGVRGTPILPRNVRNVISGYNKLTNQIYNNLEAESPKIFVHETSGVDAQRMPNGITVCEWRGNQKPTIETPSTNTTSIFKFREDLKKNIIELGGQTPMVRGDTPNAQLDSFIALQHFEDQRMQLASPDIKGHIKCMEHLYKVLIMIGQDHYEPEDQRMIKIVGRNNKFNLKYFDPENLSKVYDVKISTTGNLANSKAARTQFIMTVKREFPDIINNELFVDLIGLSSSEKFQNTVTAAVNSAESENEDMLNGTPVPPPERYEDLITHWDTHRIPLQGREYKVAPPEVKLLFERHMTATEKLMYDQAAESDTFASRLASLRQFPLFFSPLPNNEPPPSPMEGAEEVEGIEQETGVPPQEIESMEGGGGQPLPEQLPLEQAEELPQPL